MIFTIILHEIFDYSFFSLNTFAENINAIIDGIRDKIKLLKYANFIGLIEKFYLFLPQSVIYITQRKQNLYVINYTLFFLYYKFRLNGQNSG